MITDQLAPGIGLFDGAKSGGGGEQRHHIVFSDNPPINPGIGGTNRFALEHNRRRAMQQRPVDDVGMTHHPADVRRRPEDLTWFDAIDILHRPFERHHVPAIVANDALGLAGGARGVKDIKRVGGGDGLFPAARISAISSDQS